MSKNRDRAKELRHDQTEAEFFVWSQLRGRRFSGYKFRRQVPLGNYIVDFVCLDRRVIVELDGGQHNEANRKMYDARRDAWLRREGYEVLRFWNSDVFYRMGGNRRRDLAHIGRPSVETTPLTPGPSPPRGEGRAEAGGEH